MRLLTLLSTLLFALQLQAQDVKGYYITDSGKKVDGYFKYADFFDTPALKFKESKNHEFSVLPQNVTEYGLIEDQLKFEKHSVKMDISGNNSFNKEPEWSDKTIFLNVLIEGNATLYSYAKEYKTTFFFTTIAKPNEVNQLIYKKYKVSEESVAENNSFRQQLYNAVKCDGQKVSDFTTIIYDKKQLSDVFKKYNECNGSKSEVYGPKKKSDFKYSLFAGLHNLNVGIDNASPAVDNQLKMNYSFGVEVAYTFPSGGPGLFFRVEYESLKSEIKDAYDQGYNVLESTYKIKGNSLNFIFGPRYNFHLADKHVLFLDAGLSLCLPIAADIEKTTMIYPINNGAPYSGDNNKFDLGTAFGINTGFGYVFNDKYSLTLRYVTKRDYLDDVSSTFKTNITRFGIVAGYSLD